MKCSGFVSFLRKVFCCASGKKRLRYRVKGGDESVNPTDIEGQIDEGNVGGSGSSRTAVTPFRVVGSTLLAINSGPAVYWYYPSGKNLIIKKFKFPHTPFARSVGVFASSANFLLYVEKSVMLTGRLERLGKEFKGLVCSSGNRRNSLTGKERAAGIFKFVGKNGVIVVIAHYGAVPYKFIETTLALNNGFNSTVAEIFGWSTYVAKLTLFFESIHGLIDHYSRVVSDPNRSKCTKIIFFIYPLILGISAIYVFFPGIKAYEQKGYSRAWSIVQAVPALLGDTFLTGLSTAQLVERFKKMSCGAFSCRSKTDIALSLLGIVLDFFMFYICSNAAASNAYLIYEYADFVPLAMYVLVGSAIAKFSPFRQVVTTSYYGVRDWWAKKGCCTVLKNEGHVQNEEDTPLLEKSSGRDRRCCVIL